MQDGQFQVLHQGAVFCLEFIVPLDLDGATAGVDNEVADREKDMIRGFGIMRLGEIPLAHAQPADDRRAKHGEKPLAVRVGVHHRARGNEASKNALLCNLTVEMDGQRIDKFGKGDDFLLAVLHKAKREGFARVDRVPIEEYRRKLLLWHYSCNFDTGTRPRF
jgi:hypothetical protein